VLCLVIGGLFSLLGILLVQPLFGIPFMEVTNVISDLSVDINIQVLKFIQFFNTLGLFWLPGIVFVVLLYISPIEFLRLRQFARPQLLMLVVVLFFSFLPLLNLVAMVNAEMQLPEWLAGIEEWMRQSEDGAAEITKAFLRMEQPSDLLVNILLIGILPAVGEELIFRGIIQQVINKGKKNYHIGIWVSAVLFSALHFQFYGFLPRLFLGALFGYLFVWTRNLWVPIFVHFLNNTFALLAAYYLGLEAVEEQVDQLGTTEGTYLFAIFGGLIFFSLIIYLKKSLKSYDKELL
jgi:membrane protease YdiL (CAAX protease family)